MNRLQYVQYECIKTELKEEYQKRVNFLNKRIEKRQTIQGPYQEASLVLKHNSMVEIGDVYMTKTKENSPHKGLEPRNDRRSKQISSRKL